MSYTPPLKVRYGTAAEPWHNLSLWYEAGTQLPVQRDPTSSPHYRPIHWTALGQMGWPGLFGVEPRLLAAGSFAAGALAMHLLRRFRVLNANRRPRRRGRR